MTLTTNRRGPRTRLSEKALGAAAVIMALCCAALPVAGGVLAGGLAFGGGMVGIALAVIVLATLGSLLVRRRRRSGCSPGRATITQAAASSDTPLDIKST